MSRRRQLGHRGQRRERPPVRPGPGRLVDELLGPVERGDGVRQVVRQRLEGAERLVELPPVLGVLGGDLERIARAPTAWAARSTRPGSRTCCQVAQPLPGGPMRSSSPTATPDSATSYWVSEARLNCWRRLTPGAAGSTRNRSTASAASPVRARTTSRSADEAKATWRLRPESRNPEPSATARASTPWGVNPLSGSSQAGVTMASPAATGRSQRSFWAALPAAASTPPLMTALTKCGVGASVRPSSS